MRPLRNFVRLSLLAIAAVAFVSPAATAQDYPSPSRTITILVPTQPGGLADIVARVFATGLSQRTGARVVVEGKTAAGGVLAAESVAKAAPDGYTLYSGYHATNSMFQHFDRKLNFDPEKDFAPISLVVAGKNLLVVNPSTNVKTVAELVALLKSQPGKFSFASAGVGTISHLLGEQFQIATGTQMNHVPYRGAAPAAQDVVAGHVPVFFDLLGLALENVRGGKMTALAYLADERAQQLPNVPTMKELGYEGFVGGAWFGLLAPAATPDPIVSWLNKEATAIFSAPENRQVFERQGLTLPLGTQQQFAAFLRAESDRWRDIIRKSGVKLQ
jgi:tripartite-type tricarboxylate transporter receptor subunit TctC